MVSLGENLEAKMVEVQVVIIFQYLFSFLSSNKQKDVGGAGEQGIFFYVLALK